MQPLTRKKGKLLARSIDRIPDDILSEGILNKLPLTSLCTCKCVSKLWNSLIIQNYHHSQRIPIICRIGLSTNPLRLCSIDFNNGTVTPIYNPIDLGPNELWQPICSNGFICYDNPTDGQNFVVINPATQEKKLVPNNLYEYDIHHFGFDRCSNKFKLFCCKIFGRKKYEVSTLGTGLWRKVNSRTIQRSGTIQGSGKRCSMLFCVNGIIYWYSDTRMIIFFHLGTESFGVFKGPNSETPIMKVNYMFDLEGCLCLAVSPCKLDKILDLWMLKDQYNVNSGWVLIASVNKPPGKEIFWICPYFIRTGELLLAQRVEQGSQSFYLYSLLTRQFQNVKICGKDSYYILNNFRENLATLKDFL